VLFPTGFSITELQRKQAMLNASKQATGKPKGKWVVIPLPCRLLHSCSKESYLAPWTSTEVPAALSRRVFPKAGNKGPQMTKFASVYGCSCS
jgi:hypothetical protein